MTTRNPLESRFVLIQLKRTIEEHFEFPLLDQIRDLLKLVRTGLDDEEQSLDIIRNILSRPRGFRRLHDAD